MKKRPDCGASGGNARRKHPRGALKALRKRIREAEELAQAFKSGEIDAVVHPGPAGAQVFTLTGAEHAYRVMVETMSDGAATLAHDGLILYCNRRLAELLQENLECVIGAELRQFVEVGEVGRFDSLMQQAHYLTVRERFHLRRSDGELIPVYLALSSIAPAETGSVVLVVTDLSELTCAERAQEALVQQLREATAMAERANNAKSEFLANMSHEIRTPLNAVLGLGYLLEQTQLGEDQRQLLTKIQFAGRALLGVINDVLDLAKVEAGEVVLEDEPFCLPEMIQHLGQMLDPQASAKGIELVVRPAADLPGRIRGDEARLRQILLNLLGNSIKFTEAGRVELNVHCVRRTATTVRLRFDVIDTGIGMQAEVLERLFTPFMQADASTTRRFGGTGLGLSIVRRYAQLMGGNVGVTSEVGVGSTFWVEISFPRVPDTEVAEIDNGNRGLRLLLSGPANQVRHDLEAMVRALSWTPKIAETGTQLLEILAGTPPSAWPDGLVVALPLTDMDAHQLTQRLRETCKRFECPPAVFICDASLPIAEDIPLRAIDTLLVRPVTSSALFNAVNAALSKADESRERLWESTDFDGMSAQWLPGVHALVVDDSDINLEVAKRILEKQGAIVATCSDGAEAIDFVRDNHQQLDVVLMDVQMPVLDGNEATRRIRGDPTLPRLPIVALTAGALVGERLRALEAGMTDFVSKPFEPQVLIRKLRRILEEARGKPLPMIALDRSVQTSAADGLLMASVDAKVVQRMFGDDVGLFKSTLSLLLKDYSDFPGPISRAWEDPAARELLAARAHRLKGGAGVIGATELSRLAGALEQALHNERPVEVLEEMLGRLAVSLATLREESESFLGPQHSVAPTQEALTTQSISPSQIGDLTALLESHNLAALDRFGSLADQLLAVLGSLRFERLREAIENLDFETGAEVLREWRQAAGRSGESRAIETHMCE